MNTFRLVITTPEGLQFDGQAQSLSVRAVDGDLCVMAGHIPMVTALKKGECSVVDENGKRYAECSAGLLSVQKKETRLLSTDFWWRENIHER